MPASETWPSCIVCNDYISAVSCLQQDGQRYLQRTTDEHVSLLLNED